jgi:hypothetical protein
VKEVLTKSFWQGVKKTYDEALEGPPPKDGPPAAPAEISVDPSPTPETQSPPSRSSE